MNKNLCFFYQKYCLTFPNMESFPPDETNDFTQSNLWPVFKKSARLNEVKLLASFFVVDQLRNTVTLRLKQFATSCYILLLIKLQRAILYSAAIQDSRTSPDF